MYGIYATRSNFKKVISPVSDHGMPSIFAADPGYHNRPRVATPLYDVELFYDGDEMGS